MEDYDITLKHCPGTQNKTADALSCHPDYDTGTGDNQGVMVLPAHMFINAIEDNPPPQTSSLNDTISTTQHANLDLLQPLLQKHNLSVLWGLHWKNDTLIVVKDNNLKKGVVQFYHDTPTAGHPGISNTFALIKCIYWWPYMKQFITDYVKGWVQCQANKVNTHKVLPLLFLITPKDNALPFKVIAMDFITKLPKS
jgi:hypothetical protein